MATKATYEELERRLAETESQLGLVREAEREKALILENANVIIAYHDLDNNLVWANRSYLASTGLSPSQLAGKKCYTCWGLPDLCFDCPVVLAMRTGEPQSAELTSDNQPDWPVDQGSWLVHATPVRDESGKIIGAVEIAYDISGRIQAEKALRESEERFRAVFESSSDCILVWDREYNYIYANQSAIDHVGTTRDKVIGKNIRDGLGHVPNFMRLWMSRVDRAFATGESFRVEDAVPIAGRLVYSESQVSPIRDVSGQIFAVGVVYRDMTERKLAEEALAKAKDQLEQRVAERTAELVERAAQLRALAGRLTLSEQRERRRIAKVLHDHLQQLLVAAKFRVTMMGRSDDETLSRGASQIERLLDDCIRESRLLTAELSPPILQEISLTPGLEWLVRWMADTHGLAVHLSGEPDFPPLVEDVRVLLFESVRELLFNAVKHARAKSATVNLGRLEAGDLRITVSDTGSGFDPAVLNNSDETRTGFGLLSIRERLGLIGGSLEIDSVPGKGSRFLLTVPLAGGVVLPSPPVQAVLPPDPEEPHPVEAGLPERPSVPIRVLLADDHVLMREGLAQLLGQEPDIQIVGQAADGQEAVELAANLLPDVILMDLSMPKLTGDQATRVIHQEHPQISIIGLSMFEASDRAQALLHAGAVNYLTKSGPPNELIAAIRACMQ